MSSRLMLTFYSLAFLVPLNLFGSAYGLQKWAQQPRYQEVNPRGTIVLPCVILNKKGECRWEKDGTPVGIYPHKYEWSSSPENGDCSLRILDANLEYDDGVWQCQVTPSSFSVKDALISEGAELVVRGKKSRRRPFKAVRKWSKAFLVGNLSFVFVSCCYFILTDTFPRSFQVRPPPPSYPPSVHVGEFSEQSHFTFCCLLNEKF